jgi:hypothetical protein
MRNLFPAAACAVAMLGRVGSAAAQDDTEQQRERIKQSLESAIESGTTNAETYDTNGFHVESARVEELGANLRPNGTRFQMLEVSSPGTFRVGIENGRPMSTGGGLALFHRDSGAPLLSVGDSDGDGALDILTYSKVDQDGKAILDVIDYESDGQADFRIHFVDSYMEVWHVDRWYRVENRGGVRGIVLNGNFVALKRENNRYIVP